ncbi:MAG: Bacillopeptidase F [Candidatus Roizmanbacteria bacterium GW2011_GWA2_35_19]|uniref:Bacillopeptidase F n=1 Tax=Candidatus Roizmanbacteria bacterium GW2011_GWA2_35_19 TaxID=1618478 RepID=A0A0G0E8R2_9BACT|nr:MAG: Bacillopeptidase F [Candidatus Roizmanbacteria bacterium GW2011_GWA2_35_19]
MNQKYIFVFLLILVIVMSSMLFKSLQKVSTPGENNNGQINKINNDNKGDSQNIDTESGITLMIENPSDKETVNSQSVKVTGKTSAMAEVFVNEKETKADQNGNFSIEIILEEGENIINVTANDSAGNFAEKEITVYLESTQ